MAQKLKYTITEFNPVRRELTVVFEDKTTANIILQEPLPVDQADLEEIISSYTMPTDLILVKKATGDLSFIKPLIGVTGTVDRNQSSATNPTKDIDLRPHDTELSNVAIRDGLVKQLDGLVPRDLDPAGNSYLIGIVTYRQWLLAMDKQVDWPRIAVWPDPPYTTVK